MAVEILDTLGLKCPQPVLKIAVRAPDMHPGDILVLYTDGLIEAVSARGEQFGLERLESIVCKTKNDPHNTDFEASNVERERPRRIAITLHNQTKK